MLPISELQDLGKLAWAQNIGLDSTIKGEENSPWASLRSSGSFGNNNILPEGPDSHHGHPSQFTTTL